MDRRFDAMDTRLGKLEVGQEPMGDQIKQIAEGHAAVIAAIRSGIRTVCAHFDEQIEPLEDAVGLHFRA
ncbi:MAG TPA: hypothetical protein VFV78_07785 [Vicinamibacterales bacterium]|nr:hypothetical protein [Vicinamibacterales bacterium]